MVLVALCAYFIHFQDNILIFIQLGSCTEGFPVYLPSSHIQDLAQQPLDSLFP